ncbi:hypothetical protein MPC4_10013 [Methylocella tundrae]|uniref:Uncharacterized protein n=1 Tax=Methylocella tundrae TaxID=227605 RepID=A0A8B6M102_METTU|nr:hypothetical protein MPC4_10013 [Methylocella tundrae]
MLERVTARRGATIFQLCADTMARNSVTVDAQSIVRFAESEHGSILSPFRILFTKSASTSSQNSRRRLALQQIDGGARRRMNERDLQCLA